MKLSTAIRIGSMTTKQITGKTTDGGNGRCAIGAALDAAGIQPHGTHWLAQFARAFPSYSSVMHDVWMMNDGAGVWEGRPQTREQIADYVEKWENEHDGYISTGITESKPLQLIAMEAK